MSAEDRSDAAAAAPPVPPPPPTLDGEERRVLLELARDALVLSLRSPAAVSPALIAREILSRRPGGVPRGLEQEAGAFVTLTEGGALRGCIGQVTATAPLWSTVAEMAVAAATRDPRFPPLSAEEIRDLEIEITVLGPLAGVPPESRDPEGRFVHVGRDGIQMARGPRRGLLLPQVAVKYGWGPRRFLDETALKAGLEPGIWLDPATEVWLFRGESFAHDGGDGGR